MRLLLIYSFLFWVNIKLTRDILSVIVSTDVIFDILISVSMYGIVGIFVRIAFGYLYELIKTKLIIATNLVALIVMAANETEYLGISLGILASLWGFLNLLSRSDKGNLVSNISFIGLTPLAADLLASPMQYIILTWYDVSYFKYLSVCLLVIMTGMSFFIKEAAKTETTTPTRQDFSLRGVEICVMAVVLLCFKYFISSNSLSFMFQQITTGYFYISYHTVVFTLGNIVGVYFYKTLPRWYLLIPAFTFVYLFGEPNLILFYSLFQGVFFSAIYTKMIYMSVKNSAGVFQGFLQACCSLGIILGGFGIYLVKIDIVYYVIFGYLLWILIIILSKHLEKVG